MIENLEILVSLAAEPNFFYGNYIDDMIHYIVTVYTSAGQE